ncbi:MAG TPA: hypothetical protein DCM14_01740 [Clostridiales bacterium UBA8153]|nr:hypothetical protein [Clostridiales bacterium UBA8153]
MGRFAVREALQLLSALRNALLIDAGFQVSWLLCGGRQRPGLFRLHPYPCRGPRCQCRPRALGYLFLTMLFRVVRYMQALGERASGNP